MANIHATLNDLFTGIANAIRAKNGSTETIIADNFPTEIANLKAGFDYNNQNVTEIPNYGFYRCKDLKSVDCCNLTSIGAFAFFDCSNLISFTIPNNITEIERDAFQGTPWLTKKQEENPLVVVSNILIDGKMAKGDITIPDTVASISIEAFNTCLTITSIVVPNSVFTMGMGAFRACQNLVSADLQCRIDCLPAQIFYNCSSLENVIIPDSITDIGTYAFYGCSNLMSITYTGTITQWKAITLNTSWDKYTPDYIIHCTDGDIAKDGTITYHNNQI